MITRKSKEEIRKNNMEVVSMILIGIVGFFTFVNSILLIVLLFKNSEIRDFKKAISSTTNKIVDIHRFINISLADAIKQIKNTNDIINLRFNNPNYVPRNQRFLQQQGGSYPIPPNSNYRGNRYDPDFKRNSFFGMEAEVKAIEYDPNRGPRIALVEYQNGKKSYILAAQGLKVGDKVISSNEKIEAKTGNRMPLEKIPVGLFIYNVELTPGKGGQLVRGAGNAAQLLGI